MPLDHTHIKADIIELLTKSNEPLRSVLIAKHTKHKAQHVMEALVELKREGRVDYNKRLGGWEIVK